MNIELRKSWKSPNLTSFSFLTSACLSPHYSSLFFNSNSLKTPYDSEQECILMPYRSLQAWMISNYMNGLFEFLLCLDSPGCQREGKRLAKQPSENPKQSYHAQNYDSGRLYRIHLYCFIYVLFALLLLLQCHPSLYGLDPALPRRRYEHHFSIISDAQKSSPYLSQNAGFLPSHPRKYHAPELL